jgi:hypothetical protein
MTTVSGHEPLRSMGKVSGHTLKKMARFSRALIPLLVYQEAGRVMGQFMSNIPWLGIAMFRKFVFGVTG